MPINIAAPGNMRCRYMGENGASITVKSIASLAVIVAMCLCSALARAADAPTSQPAEKDSIPGTLVTFEMVKIPAGKITITPADGKSQEVEIKPFLIGRTEVTWDEYDVFAFQLDLTDKEKAAGIEAKSRPSKPYGAPDFGFGHRGLPAMCVTAHSAEMYCQWLSKKTGKKYRLATEAEWEYACRAGEAAEGKPLDAGQLKKVAWFYDNAEDKAHPVAKKAPNAWGLYDMLGNVREWVTGLDGKPVTCGGSYDDDPENVQCGTRQKQTADWNSTDPQNPKSKWWLSDGPMVGFRIVRDAE
jgi:formylglycine-generating enzyme required for sulfatase activity